MRSSSEYRNEGDDRSAMRRHEEYRRNRAEAEEEKREGKPRHHSWHPDRGQSDIDVRPRRGEGYPDVDRRSEGSWYQDRPRSEPLKIKPCDYFNSLGFCHYKSGHRSKSGTRVILHICRR